MSEVSALTIARGRDAHLANVVRGFARQSIKPVELVIGVMQADLYRNLPMAPFPIRQIRIPGEELPLATARNTVADAARGELLVFVDVDCIPHPDLVRDYRHTAETTRGLLMGEVAYLPKGSADVIDYARYEEVAVRHSDRHGPPAGPVDRCNDYRCFWSLNFAMSAATWVSSGGFDTRFSGYGGEDTDFGRTLDARGIPIWWTRGAKVYHQHHPHFMPPVHHIASVLRNAEVFASKWGHRTMEHWLYAFREMGLIENTPAGLRIVREPAEHDFALCRQQQDEPYASTRRVLDALHHHALPDGEHHRRAAVEAAQSELLSAPEP